MARWAAPKFGDLPAGKVLRTHTHISGGRDGISTFLEDVQAEAAWRGPGACRGTAGRDWQGTQPGARAGARRRHHAAGRGQQYLPVAVDDSAADLAIATTIQLIQQPQTTDPALQHSSTLRHQTLVADPDPNPNPNAHRPIPCRWHGRPAYWCQPQLRPQPQP